MAPGVQGHDPAGNQDSAACHSPAQHWATQPNTELGDLRACTMMARVQEVVPPLSVR